MERVLVGAHNMSLAGSCADFRRAAEAIVDMALLSVELGRGRRINPSVRETLIAWMLAEPHALDELRDGTSVDSCL